MMMGEISGLHGLGIYTAESSTKSDAYAGNLVLMVVVMIMKMT
jgi:hypothetical protein